MLERIAFVLQEFIPSKRVFVGENDNLESFFNFIFDLKYEMVYEVY